MPLTRRAFIRHAAGGTIVVAAAPRYLVGQLVSKPGGSVAQALVLEISEKVPARYRVRRAPFGSFADERLPLATAFRLIRPVDLLDLSFDWKNVTIEDDGEFNPPLLRKKAGKAYLRVLFPPQHTLEEAIESWGRASLPVRSHLCGPSRLVFEIPDTNSRNLTEYDYTVKTCLNWKQFPPSVVPHALSPDYLVTDRVEPRNPTEDETAIELPWGLLLSPDRDEQWQNPLPQEEGKRRYTMWATRLVRHKGAGPVSVRAIGFNPSDAENAEVAASDLNQLSDWYARLTSTRPPIAAQYVRTRLRAQTLELLNTSSTSSAETVRLELAKDLNEIIAGPSIYSKDRFAGLTLSRETEMLALLDPRSADETRRLNRLLLNDTFPPENLSHAVRPLWPLPTGKDRETLVRQTSNFNVFYDDGHRYLPKHADVKALLLSSQGAYAKLGAAWTVEEMIGLPADSIDELQQETIWNRDQKVKVGKPGFIMPFGHPVSFVELRQRELREDTTNGQGVVAVIKRRFFCVVRRPVMEYLKPADGLSGTGRGQSYQRVELSPVETPFLHDWRRTKGWMLLERGDPGNPAEEDFFKFKVVALDWDGKEHRFELPLYWMPLAAAISGTGLNDKLLEYRLHPQRRTAVMAGQKVAFAPSGKLAEQDCAIETARMLWDVSSPVDAPRSWRVRFYPYVEFATVRLAQTAPFDTGGANGGARFEYHPTYLDDGFGPKNSNEVVGRIRDAHMGFPGKKSGGLCTPSVAIGLISRRFGPIGDSSLELPPLGSGPAPLRSAAANDAFVSGGFNAKAFFGTAAKLIGGIDLAEVVEDIENAYAEAARVPKLVAQVAEELKAEFDEIRNTVQRVTDLLERVSDLSQLSFAELKKRIRDEIVTRCTARIDEARQALLRRLIPEVANLMALRDAVAAGLRKFLDGVINASALDAAVDKALAAIAGSEDDIKRLASFLELLRSRPALEQFLQERLVAEFEDVKQLKESELHSRVGVLVEFLFSPDFSRYLTATVSTAAEEQLRAKVLAPLAAELAAIAGPAAEYLVYNAEVVASLAVAWDNPDLVRDTLLAKLDQTLTGLSVAARNKVRSAINDYFRTRQADLKTELSAANTSMVQFREYVSAELVRVRSQLSAQELSRQLAHAAGVLNPFLLRDQFENVARAIETVMATLRELPGSLVNSLRSELRRQLEALANPLALTGGIKQTITSLRATIERLAGAEAGQVTPASVAAGLQQLLVDAAGKLQTAALNTFTGGLDGTFVKMLDEFTKQPLHTSVRAKVDAYLNERRKELSSLMGIAGKDLEEQARKWVSNSSVQAALKSAADVLAGIFQQVLDALATFERLEETISRSIPKEITVDYSWEPKLKSSGAFEASRDGRRAALVMKSHVRQSLAPTEIAKPPSVRVEGVMTDFALRLLPSTRFITIVFKRLSFVSVDGSSPDVKVEIERVVFGEALKFVQELAKALSPDSGFFLQLSGEGVEAGYRFALPAIATGGFNLMQLSINCSVVLPFDGSPVRARFALSEPDRPCLLSVGIWGGGAFFAISLTPRGVEKLEGSFEFGAVIALDVGVAAGVVTVTGGIYFSQQRGSAILRGFVRAMGAMRVFGFGTVSAQFYLGLSYEKRGNRTLAVGEAVYTAEFDMGFFSVSVSLPYRKELKGSSEEQSTNQGGPSRFVTAASTAFQSGDPAGSLSLRVDAYQAHRRTWAYYRSRHYRSAKASAPQ